MLTQIRSAITAVERSPIKSLPDDVVDNFVQVMNDFISTSTERVTKLDDHFKGTLHKTERLARYFGETGMKWEELFEIFGMFANQYKQAEADIVKERELEKQRKKAKEMQLKLQQKRKSSQEHA